MEEEVKRLQKEMLKIEKEITLTERKLSNQQFLSNAPAGVVEEVKEKALEYRGRRDRLEENVRKIRGVLG